MDALVSVSRIQTRLQTDICNSSQESKLGMLSSFPSASFAYVPVSTFSNEETYVKGVESLTLTGPAESKTIQKQKEWIKSNVPHLE